MLQRTITKFLERNEKKIESFSKEIKSHGREIKDPLETLGLKMHNQNKTSMDGVSSRIEGRKREKNL